MDDTAHVLVVEDNASNSELVSDLLELHGYRVTVAVDAAEAFQHLGERRPVLIIMDIQLPEVDGLAATRTLKDRPDTRDIPILALTALAMKGDRERALEAGCDGYLPKPFETHDLLRAVQALTAGRTPPGAPQEAGR